MRKSNKTKGEFCEEARIAVRNPLKTKEGDFEGDSSFGRRWSLRSARLEREGVATGVLAVAWRQKRETERAEERTSCESITQNEFPCQLIN